MFAKRIFFSLSFLFLRVSLLLQGSKRDEQSTTRTRTRFFEKCLSSIPCYCFTYVQMLQETHTQTNNNSSSSNTFAAVRIDKMFGRLPGCSRMHDYQSLHTFFSLVHSFGHGCTYKPAYQKSQPNHHIVRVLSWFFLNAISLELHVPKRASKLMGLVCV